MVKTKVTNRLHESTITNRLLARQHLVRQDKQCYNWMPSKELIDTVCFGQCHSRYTARLNNASERDSTISTITLSDYDVVDVVKVRNEEEEPHFVNNIRELMSLLYLIQVYEL